MIGSYSDMSWDLEFFGAVKPFVTVIALVMFWTWESVAPLISHRGRWRHGVRNVVVAIVNTLTLMALFAGLTLWVTTYVREQRIGLLNMLTLSRAAHLICALLILDLWLYVWHRMNHQIGWLWRFHRMHHSDHSMDVTTATRFHPGEHLTGAALRLVLIAMVGIEMMELLLYESIVVAVTMLHHANISLGWADAQLRWLIVTPRMHQIHHSREVLETNSNYSVVLPIWDYLCGSYVMRDDHSEVHVGLDEFPGEQWQTVLGMMKTPVATIEESASDTREE